MDCSTPGFPILHSLPEFAQTYVHWVSDAIQPSHPLSPPSPPAFNLSQHQGLFQWAGSWHQQAKVLELQLQHQSFQWIFTVVYTKKEKKKKKTNHYILTNKVLLLSHPAPLSGCLSLFLFLLLGESLLLGRWLEMFSIRLFWRGDGSLDLTPSMFTRQHSSLPQVGGGLRCYVGHKGGNWEAHPPKEHSEDMSAFTPCLVHSLHSNSGSWRKGEELKEVTVCRNSFCWRRVGAFRA